MFSSPEETIDIADAIEANDTTSKFAIYEQSRENILKGDWRPCQFYDPKLYRAALYLENDNNYVQLKNRYALGPAGQGIREVFKPVDSNDEGYRVFWGRSKDLRTTMEATPEQNVSEKNKNRAEYYRSQAGHILLATKFNTLSGMCLAIYCKNPSIGSMWVPIQKLTTTIDQAKALCAWFNSTFGALGFFKNRGSTLSNPSFSQNALNSLLVPDFKKLNINHLIEAYEDTKLIPVKPWKMAANDEMRDRLDQAVALTIDFDTETIRDWRIRISREPTICNQKAKFEE